VGLAKHRMAIQIGLDEARESLRSTRICSLFDAVQEVDP
jgi:hypothetical protein